MTLVLTPEATLPMPPERRRYVSRGRQSTQALTLPREQAREARQYAQRWYVALSDWQVERALVRIPAVSYAGFADRWGYVSTLGEFLPDQCTMLELPIGQHLEGEVGQIISTMQASSVTATRQCGDLLHLIRTPGSRKPDSLLNGAGQWQPDAPRMAAYALACLSLAVVLRDTRAEFYLPYLRGVAGRDE